MNTSAMNSNPYKHIKGIAISVAGVSKTFVLPKNTIHALSAIDFELNKGTITGIVGANGSGKSTLLKIMAGITKPSTGRVILHGKVVAVLELGLGFIGDVSGAENIYHAAALFGQDAKTTAACYDAIVAFSELEEFINMPLRHYSSGMYARLAFAVVAFMQADIYLFDEVLAAGDMAFRRKALNKIKDLAAEGKTIVMVSHNINEIGEVCGTTMLLDKGKLCAMGTPVEVSQKLFSNMFGTAIKNNTEAHAVYWNSADAPGNKQFKLMALTVGTNGETSQRPIPQNCTIELKARCKVNKEAPPYTLAFTLNDFSGHPLFSDTMHLIDADSMEYNVLTEIPPALLNPGFYSIDYYVFSEENGITGTVCVLPKVLYFQIRGERVSKPFIKQMGAINVRFVSRIDKTLSEF